MVRKGGYMMENTRALCGRGVRGPFEFVSEFEELMDQALNELSPAQFELFKDNVVMILDDYEA